MNIKGIIFIISFLALIWISTIYSTLDPEIQIQLNLTGIAVSVISLILATFNFYRIHSYNIGYFCYIGSIVGFLIPIIGRIFL